MRKANMIRCAALLLAGCFLTGCSSSGIPANTVNSLEDLNGKTIACQTGTVGISLAESINNAVVNAYPKGLDAVEALRNGEADAVIIDLDPAQAFTAQYTDIRILDTKMSSEEYAIVYKQDNQELGDQLNAALDALKADGTIEEIMTHWIGDAADYVSYAPDESVQRNGTLIMGTSPDFPPYEDIRDSEVVGIDVDMMQAVCDYLGLDLVVQSMEFDEIIPQVNASNIDVGVAAMTVTADRLDQVAFTQTYAKTTQVIIVRAN